MEIGHTGISGVIDSTMVTAYMDGGTPYKTAYWTYTTTTAGSVPFYASLDRNHLLVAFSTETIATGVEEIEATGKVVYFNLQGVRVDKPAKGLFIRVRGGKAEKVVL